MKLKILLFTLVLWSCGLARGQVTSAFVKVDRSTYTTTTDSPYDISSRMPRFRSDANLGLCFGFSAAAVAQHYICEQKRIENCAKVPPSDEIAPFSAVAWANTNSPNGGVPEARNHSNIQFQGGGSNALKNAAATSFRFHSEACYPFDQFGNKYRKNNDALNAVLNSYESQFKKYKTEATAVCEECLQQEIFRDLSVSVTAEHLRSALGKENFGEFLHSLFFAKCDKLVSARPLPKFNMFPGSFKTDFKGIIAKIKDVLKKGSPLNMDGICPEFIRKNKGGQTIEACVKDSKGNPAIHSLAITGYEKRCKPNTDPLICRELLRVHNSWGPEWQKAFDGGWVDAETMVNSIKIVHPDFGSNVLSWYSDPNKETL